MRTLLLVAALCALGAVGCGSGTDEAAPPAAAETTQSSEASSRPHAPAIEGLTVEGDTISLASFLGRPVMVNVWSSW